jgi:type 1 glutamine amidotransferase
VKKENRAYDHDYGISWIHEYGKGRVFYCAHGHSEHVYWEKPMLQEYLAGVQYALGDLEADAAPSNPPTPAAK